MLCCPTVDGRAAARLPVEERLFPPPAASADCRAFQAASQREGLRGPRIVATQGVRQSRCGTLFACQIRITRLSQLMSFVWRAMPIDIFSHWATALLHGACTNVCRAEHGSQGATSSELLCRR